MDRRGSLEKGHKWLKTLQPSARSFLNLPPLLLARAVGLQHLWWGVGWGGGQRWDLTWKPIIAQETVSPTWASRVGRNRWQGLWPPFCCPLSLPIDLLWNSPIQRPDPPPSPMLSEKQADTFVQQWRHKFALSLNSSWGFFLYQLLEFFKHRDSKELWATAVGAVLCCGALYTYLLRYL